MLYNNGRWNAGCGESRTSGVKWGKIRRLLQRITYHYSPKLPFSKPLCCICCTRPRPKNKTSRFKTANYEQQSVADFNQSLAPDNGDISGLLDAQAEVLASISPDDENYEFITMTLAASLDELYCEQMNDSVGLSAYLKREERPLEKLPGEESVAGAEITYFSP